MTVLLLITFALTREPSYTDSRLQRFCWNPYTYYFCISDKKKTRSALEMINAFLLKAVPNVLEFNQNYLFLVSFAVVSFTLVH